MVIYSFSAIRAEMLFILFFFRIYVEAEQEFTESEKAMIWDAGKAFAGKMKQYVGLDPFAQPFRDFENAIEPNEEQRAFARWVNHKAIFRSILWGEYAGGTWERNKKHYGYA
jgi:hypothetical protein